MKRTIIRSVATIAATPLLLGLAGCGDDDEPTADPTPAAGESVTSSPPPAVEPSESPTSSGRGEQVADPAGLFAKLQSAMEEAGTAKVSLDTGMGTATGAFDTSGDEPRMQLKTELGGMVAMEMRFVDGTLYVSMPPAPAGKFFEVPDTDALGLGSTLRSSSPTDSIADIGKALQRLVRVGEERIDGVRTTHYRATIDTKESALLSGSAQLDEEALKNLPATLDVDFWIDQDDLARRMKMGAGGVGLQLDYSDWGKPVKIDAPAAGDIVEAPKGMGM